MEPRKPQVYVSGRSIAARSALTAVLLLVGTMAAPGAPDSGGNFRRGRNFSKSDLPPRGLVIFKRHIQADEHAPVIEYSTVKLVVVAIDMIRHGGGFVSIPRHQLVQQVVYPQETADLRTDVQFEKARGRLEEFQQLADRYHKAAAHLQPWIARLNHEVTMWEDGYCRVAGQWVNRSGFDYDRQVAKLRAAFEEKRAVILGATWQPPTAEPADEKPLPPMWALDLEQQLKEEQEARREARKKSIEERRHRRSERFIETVEEERPFRTGRRIKEPGKANR